MELQDYSVDNAAFSFALDDARAADKENSWAVTPKTARELDESGARTFMDAKGSTIMVCEERLIIALQMTMMLGA